MITEYTAEPLFLNDGCKDGHIRLYLRQTKMSDEKQPTDYDVRCIEYEQYDVLTKKKLLETQDIFETYPMLKKQIEKQNIRYYHVFNILCTNYFVNMKGLQTFSIMFDAHTEYDGMKEILFILEANGANVKKFNDSAIYIQSIKGFKLSILCCICVYNIRKKQVSVTGIRKRQDAQIVYDLVSGVFWNNYND